MKKKKEKKIPCCQQLVEVTLAKETPISKANSAAQSQHQNNSCEWFQKPVSKRISYFTSAQQSRGLLKLNWVDLTLMLAAQA